MPWRVPRRLQCTPWWGLLLALALLSPSHAAASPQVRAAGPITIVFGQELGNIRPFTITIGASGAVRASGPIRLNGARPLAGDTVAALVLLARAEGFRTLPALTACPGVLPDIATRYVEIHTARWNHRAGARGSCVPALNQLFAVLMAVTHASF